MSNPAKAIGSIARRRGGDDWNLTPSAADDLATARFEILDFRRKGTRGGPAPAGENTAHGKDPAPAEGNGSGAKDGADDQPAANGSG